MMTCRDGVLRRENHFVASVPLADTKNTVYVEPEP
jgi:hypothetical protein